MTSATLATVQALVKTCLTANAAFEDLPIFLELDESATPAELAQLEAEFENALATVGVAIIVLSPELATIDKCERAGLSAELAVPIAICENPAVNRGEADATTSPARTPAGLSARLLVETAISALLPEFIFPPQPAGRPQWDNGFWAYYLVAHKRHLIRAA